MNKITTRIGQMTYDKEQRILHMKVFEGAEIELEDAIRQFEAARELTKGDKYLKVIDGRAHATASKQAREYTAKLKPGDERIAEALVVTSTATKLIGNFYININKPEVPTRIFSSHEQAMEWLKGYLYLTDVNLLFAKKRKKSLI